MILAALVAIAVPVFTGLQDSTEDSARESVAANAAMHTAAGLARQPAQPVTSASLEAYGNAGQYTLSITDGGDIGRFCITVEEAGKTTKRSGPGCSTTSD